MYLGKFNMKTIENQSLDLAEARFRSALVNSLALDEFVGLIKDTKYTNTLTLYYKDGDEYGICRVHAARDDRDNNEELIFFSFEPTVLEWDSDNGAIPTIKQSLFLKETYGDRWFVTDPALDALHV